MHVACRRLKEKKNDFYLYATSNSQPATSDIQHATGTQQLLSDRCLIISSDHGLLKG
jgi:hypothetical protein